MATTQTTYGVVSLGDRLAKAEDDRGRVRLREDLDVGAFGANALYQRKAGETIVGEHDELGPGGDRHEELYVVVQGSALFTVDGDQIEAPQGTAVAVKPEGKRSATTTSDDTIVLAIGANRDGYRITPAAAAYGFYRAYQAGDYGEALAATNHGLESHPGNAYLLYNVACMEALLGHDEAALTALAESVSKWEPYKELAQADDDFASLREDKRFVELVG